MIKISVIYIKSCDQMVQDDRCDRIPELSINLVSVPPLFCPSLMMMMPKLMMLISLSRIFVGRPFGILFSYDVPDVFGLSFSYLEHHPWLRFLVNKPEIATAPMSCSRELSILNENTENFENLIKSLGSNLGNEY